MTDTRKPSATAGHQHRPGDGGHRPGDSGHRHGPEDSVAQFLIAVSMTAGRGRAARAVADAAGLRGDDVVLDIGCGPGTAVREAARRGARATGVDPSPVMLRLARWISGLTRARQVSWLDGRAESLPVPGDSASVVWALSSVHHWEDREAGLREVRRVLCPGGRVLLVERLAAPGARGRAAHGLTADHADDLARDLAAAGISEVRTRARRVGGRTLVLIQGTQERGRQVPSFP
jgi:ubiquinone/menaquinone biosynthesis C-methylase UbiE